MHPILHRSSRHLIAAAMLASLAASPALAADAFADPSRLVVVGGSLTEIVYALGQEDKLVARDSTASHPEAVLALPDVGYMRQLSPESVLSVNPTALLVLEGSGPPDALDVLSASGVPYQTVPDGFTGDSIVAKVMAVGAALGAEAQATTLASEIEAAFDAAATTAAERTTRKRVLFVLSAQGGKLMAAGTGTAADAIIALAGADNAITQYEGYRPIDDEALTTAAPDAVLIMDNAGPPISADELFSHPGLSVTPAGQNKTLIHMNGAYLLGFGPRTPQAVTELADALYGPGN